VKEEIWICDICGKKGKEENASKGHAEADWASVRILIKRMNRYFGECDKELLLCKECADKIWKWLLTFIKEGGMNGR